MAWVRVSDDFYDNPKFIDAGPLGVAVWLSGLAYCNRNLTDGNIPESVARRLVDFDGIAYQPATSVETLVDVGLMHREGHDCERCPQPKPRHLLYHDYLEFQRSAADIQADREAAKERMRRARSAKRSPDVRANAERTDSEVRVTPTPTPTPNNSPNGELAPQQAAAKTMRGTRLDPSWMPDPELIAELRSECPNIDLQAEHRKFVDFWCSKTGKDATKLDWRRTWRNWIRNARPANGVKPRNQQETEAWLDRAMQRAIEADEADDLKGIEA